MHIFKDTKYNFLKWRWHALIVSWVIILAGIFAIATKGIPKGVEFAGGTVVITDFEKPVTVEQVRAALDASGSFSGGGQNIVVQTYGDPSTRQMLIRVPTSGAESGQALSKTKEAVIAALQKTNVGFKGVA